MTWLRVRCNLATSSSRPSQPPRKRRPCGCAYIDGYWGLTRGTRGLAARHPTRACAARGAGVVVELLAPGVSLGAMGSLLPAVKLGVVLPAERLFGSATEAARATTQGEGARPATHARAHAHAHAHAHTHTHTHGQSKLKKVSQR